MRTPRFSGLTAIVAGVLLSASVSTVLAKQTPEEKCQKGRYDAAAKYASCQQKVMGKYFAGSWKGYVDYMGKFLPALSKCQVKYTDTWAKLQAKASGTGSTCDNPRYEDNGDGTVTDWLTALQWEKKDGIDGTQWYGNPHDSDNRYRWSTLEDGDSTDADGEVYTSFLAMLNSGGCFAGQCDWRLPTVYELQTILSQPYPCATSPCIDQTVLGPTTSDFYWSSTTYASYPDVAWLVGFKDGTVNGYNLHSTYYVRAVRGGS